ncbi:MAG: sugar phosphate isomerase/epimerase [Actinobacteria bacterium]|nr:sugar phosphate isomerase/epimerase [Actinomycetota bacterium]
MKHPDRCASLIAAVRSPALRATFDAANFVQCGVRPFPQGYRLLRPYLVYLQIKDARAATGEVVPAGEGDGQVRETLAALRTSGFEGFLSLEPHLAPGWPVRGVQRPGGLHPRREIVEIHPERAGDPVALTPGARPGGRHRRGERNPAQHGGVD